SVTPWRHAAGPLVWSRIRGPLQAALAAGLVTALVGTRIGWVVLSVFASVFVIGVIVRHLFELAGRRSRATGRGFFAEARQVVTGDQGYWAGQLSHVGVALVALGLAFTSNLATHETFDLAPGDTFDFAGYEMTYRAPFQRSEPNRTVVGANIEVWSGQRLVAELQPRANHFGSDPTGIPTPAVMSGWRGDVYLMLISIDNTGIRLEANTSPLIWVLWLGGLVTAAGGFWATQVRRADRRARVLEAADACARRTRPCRRPLRALVGDQRGRDGSGAGGADRELPAAGRHRRGDRLAHPLPGLPGGADLGVPGADGSGHDGDPPPRAGRGRFAGGGHRRRFGRLPRVAPPRTGGLADDGGAVGGAARRPGRGRRPHAHAAPQPSGRGGGPGGDRGAPPPRPDPGRFGRAGGPAGGGRDRPRSGPAPAGELRGGAGRDPGRPA